MIGDTYSERPITTLPFEFPAHGHNFKYADVYIHSKEESWPNWQRWRLCRVSRCPTCLASPDAFVFHTDCFRILRRIAREQAQKQGLEYETRPSIHDTLSQIWLAGHWSRPWAKVLYNASPPLFPAPALPPKTTHLEPSELELLVGKLPRLPAELFQMVITYSPDSPLWRYAAALAWPLSAFGSLKDSNFTTPSPNDFYGWRRGEDLQTSASHRQKFVRLTLDCDGIKSVDFLDNHPVAPSSQHQPPGLWYILDKISRLGDFRLQSQVQFPSSTNAWLLTLEGPSTSPTQNTNRHMHIMGYPKPASLGFMPLLQRGQRTSTTGAEHLT